MKCLLILKPLSIKLQKRDIDVYEAYSHIRDSKNELQDIRGDIEKYCSPNPRWCLEKSDQSGAELRIQDGRAYESQPCWKTAH